MAELFIQFDMRPRGGARLIKAGLHVQPAFHIPGKVKLVPGGIIGGHNPLREKTVIVRAVFPITNLHSYLAGGDLRSQTDARFGDRIATISSRLTSPESSLARRDSTNRSYRSCLARPKPANRALAAHPGKPGFASSPEWAPPALVSAHTSSNA